jgi:hypothetical protein
VFVSAYTNSEGTLSSAKYDMLILKINTNTGLLVQAKRFGSENNDKANGLTFFNGALYVVGESDSIGWTSSRTDMIFLKIDPSSGDIEYGKYLGGSGEDSALIVTGHSDGDIYSLGNGYSVEYTAGTIDLFIVRFDEDMELLYMASFGGRNPDFAADMKVFGSNIIILGHSMSSELSQGFLDIFIAVGNKDFLNTLWVKYIGTPSFNEYAYSLSITKDGNIFALGQISANGITNGNNDLFIMSLTLTGETRFVENLGSSIMENPGGMIFNEKNNKINVFANTNSISFKNQGGLDWFIF